MSANNIISFQTVIFVMTLTLSLQACSSSQPAMSKIKDNKRETWTLNNHRIDQHLKQYRSGTHVKYALERAQSYLPYIHKVFRKYNLPPELVYLPLVESGFKPDANSGHAVGMWQFTKETAKDYGLIVGWLWDDRLDWRKSTHAAARYLDNLGLRYNYNWELALAAYNGGPGYISREMKRQRTWNFWQMRLRQETQDYVPRFLAMSQIAKRRYPALYYTGAPKFWIASRH
ncbi:transglycosylase SLT domain-containing protein [Deltaproteobacteria bacterium TL4]